MILIPELKRAACIEAFIEVLAKLGLAHHADYLKAQVKTLEIKNNVMSNVYGAQS